MRHVVGEVPQGGSPWPPIAAYAFLSDCEVCALVAPSGNVEWLCLPRFDGPSIFGAILDRDAGGFRLAPVDTTVPAGRRYLPGTLVLETTWSTNTGWIVVRDSLLIGPWHHGRERTDTHRRTPTDTDADHVLTRTVRCVNGRVDIRMECEPRPNYGLDAVSWAYDGEGYSCARARTGEGGPTLRLTTNLRLGFEGGSARARTTMRQGDTAFFALAWSEHAGPGSHHEADRRMEFTSAFWNEWLLRGSFPDHPWRIYLQRSALTLKGLTFAPTGAMIAAATTSLPETPGGSRNWDYRYSWIRDSTFMLWALYTLGFDEEANDFFYFIRDVVGVSEKLQVLYGIGGERELPERTLDHLDGYEHARPVRIGNDAYRHRQHDVWGALLDSIYMHTRSRDGLAESTWRMLCDQVEEAIAHWREPDRGIWEVRGDPKHFTSSKVMCWVACDRGARLARLRGAHDIAARWQAAADEIHEDVCANALDERGVFTQHYGATSLDASCLLLPLVRFLPPDDERIVHTVDAIAEELTVHGFVLRYRTDETDDGMIGEEASFAVCTFWLVSAQVEIGQTRRARALCEKALCYASPLYLYAEEIDPRSGRHLGNFPQAYTHLALINAVMHVIRADEALAWEEPLSAAPPAVVVIEEGD
ncbi:MAG TPA: glycoside hydrolase family 15 protein [Solirubrobacteraceae bacterium]|nr:glycoside hydrolase family 15 protein [Solirubrobacteraceae bacterium]